RDDACPPAAHHRPEHDEQYEDEGYVDRGEMTPHADEQGGGSNGAQRADGRSQQASAVVVHTSVVRLRSGPVRRLHAFLAPGQGVLMASLRQRCRATPAQMASTTPKGQAPARKP